MIEITGNHGVGGQRTIYCFMIKSCSVEVYWVIYFIKLTPYTSTEQNFILIVAILLILFIIYFLDNISYFTQSNSLQSRDVLIG